MASDNQSITASARPAVESLQRFTLLPAVQAALAQARTQALARLASQVNLRAAFVAVDLASLAVTPPAEARSLRVVVTRDAGGDTIERHANCAQYLYVMDTPLETHVQTAIGWRIDRYGQGPETALEDRWHVVPPGVWHKSVAPGAVNWSVAAFHSAADVNDEFQ